MAYALEEGNDSLLRVIIRNELAQLSSIHFTFLLNFFRMYLMTLRILGW